MTLLVIAILGFSGNIVAAIVGQILAGINARRAAREVYKLKEVTESTHKIVNNQRTVMLSLVAELSRRIANENPDDPVAQLAAHEAENESLRSGKNYR